MVVCRILPALIWLRHARQQPLSIKVANQCQNVNRDNLLVDAELPGKPTGKLLDRL